MRHTYKDEVTINFGDNQVIRKTLVTKRKELKYMYLYNEWPLWSNIEYPLGFGIEDGKAFLLFSHPLGLYHFDKNSDEGNHPSVTIPKALFFAGSIRNYGEIYVAKYNEKVQVFVLRDGIVSLLTQVPRLRAKKKYEDDPEPPVSFDAAADRDQIILTQYYDETTDCVTRYSAVTRFCM